MTTTRVLAGLVSNGNVLADGVITPAEIGVLSISSVTYPGDDQAANPAGGQTITVNGAGFASTPTVYVNGVIAPSVSFVSSTQITFTSPARSAGTYDIYVVNPSGSTAIRVYGISYSGTPTWTTAAGELGPVDANFTIQLAATGDAPLTYALTSGSTLPSGVTLSSGGLITGSALTVEQTFNFSVDAIDAQSQETPRSFSVSVSLADPYFRYVTMLLSGDTAVMPFDSDASTNNFDIAINGDVRSNNFNPYQAGYYSNYFNGSSYLQTSATQVIPTGSFTVECWAYLTSTSNQGIVAQGTTGNSARFSISVDGGLWWVQIGEAIINTAVPATNVWLYLAATFNGSTLTFYVNGTSIGSVATTNSAQNTTFAVGSLGSGWAAGSYYTTGYVSNVRVSNVVRTITTPTTPYTSDANTRFLSCQSNRFLDNSTNAFALTVSGSPQVAPAQPFTLPSSVATYGSGYFDGSGDSLKVAYGSQMNLTNQDFAIEFWAYVPSALVNKNFLCQDQGYYQLGFFVDASNNLTAYSYEASTALNFSVSFGSVPVGQWFHIALTRSGSTVAGYKNGARQNTASFAGTVGAQTGGWYIASGYSGGDNVPGYMSDVRFVIGSNPYGVGTTLTVPSAPLTAITNTQLLTTRYNGGANNSGFKDSSQNNFIVTRAGNTTQGTFTPYGSNWSAYFNGSNGSKVDLSSAPLPATGAFTFECYIFPLSFSALMIVYSQYNSSFTNRWYIGVNTNGTVVMGGNTLPPLTSTAALTLNAWNHFAVTRDGSGNGKVFINGVLSSSNTGWTTTLDTVNPRISGFANPSELCVNGYLSNIRITNTNLYTASFTVPTSPLTAVSGTTLLTLQNNRYKDNSASAITLTPASTSIQRFNPFSPTTAYSTSVIGGSGYFDGSGDYLSVANSAPLQLLGGSFTLECWIYLTAAQTNMGIVGIHDNSSTGYFIRLDTTIIRFYTSAATVDRTYSFAQNTWYHIAVSSSGTTGTLYINGVAQGATFSTNGTQDTTDPFLVGRTTTLTNYFSGYISDVRVVKGTALYTGTFTPPTAPLTAVSGTSLLLSYTNAGILDNAMMNDLETVGNAQVSTSVKKYGTGSMYFDGTGDYLNEPSSPNLGIGNVFTVECWLYLVAAPTASNAMYVTDFRGGSTNNYAFGVINSGSNTIFYAYLGAGGEIRGSTNITTGTWYHLAFVNTGSTLTGYLNGVSQGTLATSYNQGATNVIIGARYTGATEYINGYIDDLRITKGYARYTANFTPPTAALKLK